MLCLSLGFHSPDHVRDQLSARQINEWKDYYDREPFGERRDDIRNAINCLVSYRIGGGKKNHKLDHFFPKSGKRRSTRTITTPEQLERELQLIEETAKARRNGSR